MINFEDFKKIDLRIAKIIEAEKVPDSEKLIRLKIDLGPEEGERQIVAGIQAYYQTEELISREIVVVVNLEPRTIFGLESQGMLLAAKDNGAVLLEPDKEVKPGSPVS
jgi:methionine--tRNA ligase beta chain